ncbi:MULTISPECIES: hypothetical protein [unclassified Acinetobacter]|uniref:hypothetical protein n=1 Tax=unclassified Acinetobacter TaxID=196816 RepID=UPI0025C5C251|nr:MULTISPECIES: hypothetical protein [unclassified Acinetobacter]
MGGSSDQVIGYRYFTNLLLFIGNPIEKMLGINFDKRGWHTPLIDKMGNPLQQGSISQPYLYGENEGGVAGVVHARYGTDDQEVLPFYKEYMESKGLQASAYPFQSYLAFTGLGKVNTGNGWIDGAFGALAGYMNEAFYVGNSGYMKEMLLWPSRIHVRNDGRPQWYDAKAEISDFIMPDNLPSWADFYDSSYTADYRLIDGTTVSSSGLVKNGFGLNFGDNPEIGDSFGGTIQFNTGGHIYCFFATQTNNIKVDLPPDITVSKTILYNQNKSIGSDLFQTICYLEIASTGGFIVDVSSSMSDGLARSLITSRFSSEPFAESPPPHGIDINPIHKIREILTDDTAMNKPETSVNDVNFIRAADRIYDEGLGISCVFTEKNCLDAINEICYHIEAGIRVNRQTGLYEMVLFRDDWFEENEIHTIAENKIKKGSMQYEITNADEVVNKLNVNYYDRENIKNSSFSLSESGLIQTLGRENAETVDFPYFMKMRNAEIVANWKLKILSTGVLKGSFTTGWREARKWNRYDLIRLPWSRRWAEPIVVCIMNIKLGGPTSNEVSIEWVEVVPSTGMMNTTIAADNPIDTQPEAAKSCKAKVFELPYFEAVQAFGEREVEIELADNPEVGYLCAIAEKPQNNSLNAALHVDNGNGFERVATVNYCETAYLDQTIDRISSTFVVKNVGNIASVRVGSQIFINDETMVYQSYDAETKVLTVKRGAFGVPQIHTANSILYFADDFIAVGQTLYVDGEIVEAKVLTTTPSGVLALVDAATHVVEFNARAIRPYPPANVKINGEYWPLFIDEHLTLTWAHRNRVQQTGGHILGWFDGGVTPEAGVTYTVKIYDDETDLTIHEVSEITASNVVIDAQFLAPRTRLELFSVRGGYESFHKFIHVFATEALDAPYNLKLLYIADLQAPYDLNLEYL